MASEFPNPITSPLHPLFFPIAKTKWVPGKNRHFCMSCNHKIVPETYFRSGKHHCRICGHLVCSNCSRYRLKKERVCHECFYKYHKYAFKDSKLVDPRIVNKLVSLQLDSCTIQTSDCVLACQRVGNEGFDAAKEWLLSHLQYKWKPFHDFCFHDAQYATCTTVTDCVHIQRISIILTHYHQWIEGHYVDDIQPEDHFNETYGMYAFLNLNKNMPNYSNTALLNDFHHILWHHSVDNSVFNLFCDNGGCKLLECQLIKRMYDIGTDLYFGYDSKDISTQQLLDRIHCHLYHSIDAGFRFADCQNVGTREKTEQQLVHLRDNIARNQSKYKTFMHNNRITNSKFVTNVVEHAYDESNIISNYSFGFRFYYKQEDEFNHDKEIRDNIYTGYKISEWFVKAKYDNLKDEVLNNKIYSLSKCQWSYHIHKINDLFKCFKCLSLRCGLQHISSLSLYTDFGALQQEFSQTYRRTNVCQTIQNVKERHSEFAIWGSILNEAIASYGENIYKSTSPHCNFYHGINKVMSFKSTVAYFLCPVSTSTQLQVAYNFASNEGLVLRIDRYWSNNDVKYFDVSWLSNFVAEEERLFVNTNKCVQVVSIINVKTAEDYRESMCAINGIQEMVRGDMIHYKLGRIHVMEIVRALMLRRLNINTDETVNVPVYIANLFRIICDNIGSFQMNLHHIRSAFVECKYNLEFGSNKTKLKLIACDVKDILFMGHREPQWVNLYNICSLFPRLRQLWIYEPYKMHTFALSEFLFVQILHFLDSNEMKNKVFSLNCILIDHLDERYLEIDDAIGLFSTAFGARNWSLCRGLHEHSLMMGTFAAVNTYRKLLDS